MKKFLLLIIFCLSMSMVVLISSSAKVQPSGCSLSSTPVGGIMIWPTAEIPEDYFLCDGKSYRIDDYKKLFKVIGYTYTPEEEQGGDYFNVPDLRGMFVRGLDNGREIDPDRELGTKQKDAIRDIIGVVGTVINTGASGAFESSTQTINAGGNNFGISEISFDASRVVPTADENRPKNVAMNYVIRYKIILAEAQ